MTAWADHGDLVAVLRRDLSQPDTLTDRLGEDDTENAIASAQAEVTAKCAGRFDPDDPPRLLVDCCLDIAAYLLPLRYEQGDLGDGTMIVRRYERAQALLTAIQSGAAVLPKDPDVGSNGGADLAAVNPYGGDLFTPADYGLGYESPYLGFGRRGPRW